MNGLPLSAVGTVTLYIIGIVALVAGALVTRASMSHDEKFESDLAFFGLSVAGAGLALIIVVTIVTALLRV